MLWVRVFVRTMCRRCVGLIVLKKTNSLICFSSKRSVSVCMYDYYIAVSIRVYLLCGEGECVGLIVKISLMFASIPKGVDVKRMDLSDLFELHRLIWIHSSQLITALGSAKRMTFYLNIE